MNKSPAFQFYPKDWLSSLEITTMTAEQEGAYIRLLCYCWESSDCSLPNDIEILSRLSRVSKESIGVVIKCFNQHPTKANSLTHKRLLKEVQKQQLWREKSSKGGKNGAKKRWKKQEVNNQEITTVIGVVTPNDDSSVFCLQSSSTKEKKEAKASKENKRIIGSRLPSDWDLPQEWGEWTDKKFGWSVEKINTEADKFKNYWLGLAGAKATKVDWYATWQNWCYNAEEYSQRRV